MSECVQRHSGRIWYQNQPYDGITKILKSVGQTEGLTNWKIGKVIDAAQAAAVACVNREITFAEFEKRTRKKFLCAEFEKPRQQALSSGIQSHSMLEAFVLGDQAALDFYRLHVPIPFRALDEAIVREGLQPVSAEQWVMHDELGYCARFDMLALVRATKKLTVISFKKTGAIYHDHHVQLAAEASASFLASEDGPSEWAPQGAAFLHLQGDRCEFFPVDIEPAMAVVPAYVSIYRYMEDLRRCKGT